MVAKVGDKRRNEGPGEPAAKSLAVEESWPEIEALTRVISVVNRLIHYGLIYPLPMHRAECLKALLYTMDGKISATQIACTLGRIFTATLYTKEEETVHYSLGATSYFEISFTNQHIIIPVAQCSLDTLEEKVNELVTAIIHANKLSLQSSLRPFRPLSEGRHVILVNSDRKLDQDLREIVRFHQTHPGLCSDLKSDFQKFIDEKLSMGVDHTNIDILKAPCEQLELLQLNALKLYAQGAQMLSVKYVQGLMQISTALLSPRLGGAEICYHTWEECVNGFIKTLSYGVKIESETLAKLNYTLQTYYQMMVDEFGVVVKKEGEVPLTTPAHISSFEQALVYLDPNYKIPTVVTVTLQDGTSLLTLSQLRTLQEHTELFETLRKNSLGTRVTLSFTTKQFELLLYFVQNNGTMGPRQLTVQEWESLFLIAKFVELKNLKALFSAHPMNIQWIPAVNADSCLKEFDFFLETQSRLNISMGELGTYWVAFRDYVIWIYIHNNAANIQKILFRELNNFFAQPLPEWLKLKTIHLNESPKDFFLKKLKKLSPIEKVMFTSAGVVDLDFTQLPDMTTLTLVTGKPGKIHNLPTGRLNRIELKNEFAPMAAKLLECKAITTVKLLTIPSQETLDILMCHIRVGLRIIGPNDEEIMVGVPKPPGSN